MSRLWNDNAEVRDEGYGPKPALQRGIDATMREVVAKDARMPMAPARVTAGEVAEQKRRAEAAYGLDRFRQHVSALGPAERKALLGRLRPSDPLADAKKDILLEYER